MKMKMQVKTTLNVMLNAFLELGKLTLSLKYTPTQKCMQYHLNWSYWKFSLDFNAILTVENVFYQTTYKHGLIVFFCFLKTTLPRKRENYCLWHWLKEKFRCKMLYTKFCLYNQFLFCQTKKMLSKYRIFSTACL